MPFTLGQHVSPLRIAVLISGGGTTLRNLIDKIAKSQLDTKIELVISSTAKARGLDFAREAGIPTLVVPPSQFASPGEFSEATFGPCRAADVHIVAMGGYLKHVLIPDDFAGRVTNIHPALLPSFGGAGFYGRHVHEAVLESSARLSGCTAHFVDNQYDHGPIILQKTVPVLDDDTPDTLATRVFAAECEAYPEALRMIARGEIKETHAKAQRR
jgi:phosphoribosylglycinamide formyltransferase 1